MTSRVAASMLFLVACATSAPTTAVEPTAVPVEVSESSAGGTEDATSTSQETPCFAAAPPLECEDDACQAQLEARYERARQLQDEGKLDESVALLDSIVRHGPATQLNEYAAQLAIAAIVRISNPACAPVLRDTLRDYREVLCTAARPTPTSACETIQRVECQRLSLEAHRLADTQPNTASALFEELAGREDCDRRERQIGLYNAVISAEHAGDAPRAAALRQRHQREYPDAAQP